MQITESTLWKPSYLVSSTWHDHVSFAFWLMERLRPRVLLELGTQAGFSYCCFCQAIGRLDLDTRAFALGNWGEDFASDPTRFVRLGDYHRRYESFSTLVDAPFDRAVSQFDNGSIDLLHLHNAAACAAFRSDVATWSAKLSNRAILLVHGTNLPDEEPVIRQLWSELERLYPAFEFSHGHGLGILKIGASETEVDELFSLRAEAAGDVQLIFRRLGRSVAHGIRTFDYERRMREFDELSSSKQRLEERLRKHEQELLDYYAYVSEVLKTAEVQAETATRELISVRRKPFSNLRRYLKWRTSKKLGKMGWMLPRRLAEGMARGEFNNAPRSSLQG
ncbi:MAG: class I SAM-dependent methyltransferase [Rhodomicrobium sp.]